MTGTRHEKVAIIILTYVIGFVTAYILFGATQYESFTTTMANTAHTYESGRILEGQSYMPVSPSLPGAAN